jgi:transcriptional regulator GlxA family with amidase domain
MQAAAPAEAEPVFSIGQEPPPPVDRPLQVAFLVVDGVYNTELIAPYDVFQHTRNRAEGQPGMEVFTVSPDGQPIESAEGLVIVADHSFADAPEIDILVVPSAEHSRDTDLENEAMIAWVRERGEQARTVMSLCWGAFVLAEAGLLDGASCTTFPKDHASFENRFPEAHLHRAPSFVHDGRALTSQGGVKSFEAALYLVHALYGEETASSIAGGLLIEWPPSPGTVQALVVAQEPTE